MLNKVVKKVFFFKSKLFPLNLVTFRQKSSWFCIPEIDTPHLKLVIHSTQNKQRHVKCGNYLPLIWIDVRALFSQKYKQNSFLKCLGLPLHTLRAQYLKSPLSFFSTLYKGRSLPQNSFENRGRNVNMYIIFHRQEAMSPLLRIRWSIDPIISFKYVLHACTLYKCRVQWPPIAKGLFTSGFK